MIKSILLFTFSFSLFTLSAQSWKWGREGTPSPFGLGDPIGNHCVGVDKHGNVYETGLLYGLVSFGTDTVGTNNFIDASVYLTKYDTGGNAIWARQAIGSGIINTWPTSVSIDGSSNVYETGWFSDTLIFGIDTLKSNSNETSYLAKYDANGNLLWVKQAFNPPSSSSSSFDNSWNNSSDVATDLSGNAYITGYFKDTAIFGLDTLKYGSKSPTQVFMVKYAPNGNVLWAKQSTGWSKYDQDGWLANTSIALDALGNAYMTGYFDDTLHFENTTLNPTNNFMNNVFITKYSSGGNVLWAKQSTTNNDDTSAAGGNSIGVDAYGNAYITGSFYNSVAFGSDTLTVNSYTPNTSSGEDVFFVKYDTHGNVLWAKQGFLLSNTDWQGYSLMCDTLPAGGGFIIMHGQGSHPQTLKYGVDTFSLNLNSSNATVLFQFDSAGNVVCGNVSGEGGEDDDDGVAVDHAGKYVYIGGDLLATTIYGPDTLTIGDEDSFIARWNPCCISHISISPFDTSVCTGKSINLTASGATNYYWSPPTGLNTITGATVRATPTVNTTYEVAGKSTGCIGFAVATVTVGTPPIITITPANTICLGDSITLTAKGGGTYKWVNNAATDSSIRVSPSRTTVYTVMVDKGCVDSARTTISTITPIAFTACCSDSIKAGAIVNLTASGVNSYTWLPAIGLSCTNCPNPMASPTVTTIYTITGTDMNGCTTHDTITVYLEAPPCANFIVPNVFTPNYMGASGVNNKLYIKTTNINVWSLTVYDRWGKQVFTSTNPAQYWDGTTESGSNAADGVYYYLINATCQGNTYKKDGFVQLIR